MRRFVDVGRGGLHEKQIHQAVLVVVDPADTGAHGFQIIFLLRCVESCLKVIPAFSRTSVKRTGIVVSRASEVCLARAVRRTAKMMTALKAKNMAQRWRRLKAACVFDSLNIVDRERGMALVFHFSVIANIASSCADESQNL